MNVKKCRGHNGRCSWEEDYPIDQIPVEKFSISRASKDGYQDTCKRDMALYHLAQPRHPVSGICKKKWKEKFAKSLGGIQNTTEWKSYLDRAEKQWEVDCAKVVGITPRFKSEYGPSKPMTKRETVHVEGEKIPQGWVYVFRNTETPWLFKVGKTYPDGIQKRLDQARTWGCYDLEEKYWFEDALKAEKEIHALLSEHNMRNLGHKNCGTELFKCWNIGTITDAINKIQSGNDRPSIAMGK